MIVGRYIQVNISWRGGALAPSIDPPPLVDDADIWKLYLSTLTKYRYFVTSCLWAQLTD
jgi:hypothetical protein